MMEGDGGIIYPGGGGNILLHTTFGTDGVLAGKPADLVSNGKNWINRMGAIAASGGNALVPGAGGYHAAAIDTMAASYRITSQMACVTNGWAAHLFRTTATRTYGLAPAQESNILVFFSLIYPSNFTWLEFIPMVGFSRNALYPLVIDLLGNDLVVQYGSVVYANTVTLDAGDTNVGLYGYSSAAGQIISPELKVEAL